MDHLGYICPSLSLSLPVYSPRSSDFQPVCTLTLAIRSNVKHHSHLLMFDPLLLLPMGIAPPASYLQPHDPAPLLFSDPKPPWLFTSTPCVVFFLSHIAAVTLPPLSPLCPCSFEPSAGNVFRLFYLFTRLQLFHTLRVFQKRPRTFTAPSNLAIVSSCCHNIAPNRWG